MIMKRFTVENRMIRECIVDNTTGEQLDTFNYTIRLCEVLNKLNDENEQLKSELKKIYDIATVNKVKNIIEKIYDDLLYETSEESNYERKIILKCLEKIDDFGDDLE